MENKKYLDKVIGSLVRGTKMDYENEALIFPFPLLPLSTDLNSYPYFRFSILFPPSSFPLSSFSKYCKNTFGLTGEEINYVFKQYKNIIKNKIDSGE